MRTRTSIEQTGEKVNSQVEDNSNGRGSSGSVPLHVAPVTSSSPEEDYLTTQHFRSDCVAVEYTLRSPVTEVISE